MLPTKQRHSTVLSFHLSCLLHAQLSAERCKVGRVGSTARNLRRKHIKERGEKEERKRSKRGGKRRERGAKAEERGGKSRNLRRNLRRGNSATREVRSSHKMCSIVYFVVLIAPESVFCCSSIGRRQWSSFVCFVQTETASHR